MSEVKLATRDGALGLEDADGKYICGDFTKMLPRLTHSNLTHELLVKAAKVKDRAEPLAVDATAGMGEDALLLAAAGFRVILFERDETIARLLRDAMERARSDERLASVVARMTLLEADSIKGMAELAETPDVVLLDPMFPKRTKSSLVKKKFQLIHFLEPPCEDEEDLLAAAMATGAHKIVIKRPAKGPYLGGITPSYSVAGKAVRYDCIVQN